MVAKTGKRYTTQESARYLGVSRIYFLELRRKYNLKPVGKIYKENVYAASDICKISRLLKAAARMRKRLEEFTL